MPDKPDETLIEELPFEELSSEDLSSEDLPSQDTEIVLFREPADEPEEAAPRRVPKLLSVSGAKGGVGKSMLASNLAVYLASIGRSVVLADADMGGANLHTMLGVERPRPWMPAPPSLEESDREDTGLALLETPVPGLSLLHAGLDVPRRGAS